MDTYACQSRFPDFKAVTPRKPENDILPNELFYQPTFQP